MIVTLAALAALLGAALQSATGFGFALVAAPLLVATLGPRVAVGTMVVLALLVTILTVVGERRSPRFAGREVVVLLAWTVPGLVAGTVLLRVVPERALELLVAAAVLLGVGLRLRAPRGSRGPSGVRTAAAGLLSGALSTSTGLGGPPVVFHLLARGLDPAAMRDTLAALWLWGGVLSVGILAVTGTLTLPAELPLLLAVAAVGQLGGRWLFARMHGERYERAVLVLLVVTGLVALVGGAT